MTTGSDLGPNKGIYLKIVLSKITFLVTILPIYWNGFKGLAKGIYYCKLFRFTKYEKEMVRLE